MKKKTQKRLAAVLALNLAMGVLSACGSKPEPAVETEPVNDTEVGIELETAADDTEVSLTDLGMSSYAAEEGVGLEGLDGNPTIPPLDLTLTKAEIEKIREGNYKVGICFHYTGNDWSALQESALRKAFEYLGIEVIAVADSENTPEKQVADIETMLAMNPDAIVSAITDPATVETTFDKAADAGVPVVFMENVPNNYAETKQDNFVAMVTCDAYGNGVAAANIMAQQLGEEGKVGLLYWNRKTPSQVSRQAGFEDTIKNYPGIEIVTSEGFENADMVGTVTDAMLVKYPEIDAIFAPWDIPAEYATASALAAGREDMIITTVDLGQNCGRIIAENGCIKGTGAALPYDQGIAEAVCVAYALLEKELPGQYISVPTYGVTRENLLDAYELVFHTKAPEKYKELLD